MSSRGWTILFAVGLTLLLLANALVYSGWLK
jgi:hypothetical protein